MTKFPSDPNAAAIINRVQGEQLDFRQHYAGVIENAQYFFATYGNSPSSSSMEDITVNSSSPWWAGRLVGPAGGVLKVIAHGGKAEGPMVEAGEALTHTVQLGSEAPSVKVYDMTPMTLNESGLGLDFGYGVVVASGAVAAPVRTEALKQVAFGGFSALGEQVDVEWLAPDSAADIAAAIAPVDDTAWDDGEAGPTWISLADVSYRGGGVMGRRRGSTAG